MGKPRLAGTNLDHVKAIRRHLDAAHAASDRADSAATCRKAYDALVEFEEEIGRADAHLFAVEGGDDYYWQAFEMRREMDQLYEHGDRRTSFLRKCIRKVNS